jgi:fumarate reductase flavoprotein subunit
MNSAGGAIAENLVTEIVVVGGGGAGLAAAVAAAELGTKVAVLEKRRIPGGNTIFAAGMFAAETPLQKGVNIDARNEDFYKIAMSYAHYRLNGRLVRAFIDKSSDTVSWLQKKGIKFDRLFTWYPNQVLRAQHCADKFGAEVIRLLVKECSDAGVRICYNSPAKKLLTNKSGEITGVLAGGGKNQYKVGARAVIIATGGFGGNKRLLKKYCPYYTEDFVNRGIPMMGDGFTMATAIGAATEGAGTLQLEGPFFPGFGPLWRIVEEPGTIWVNKKGERFTDESIASNDFESVNAVIYQPGKISYTIFDEQIKQQFIQNGLVRILGRPITGDGLENELQAYSEKGKVKIADTWEPIARWIGADPASLQVTIDEYNSDCDRGYDKVFAKDRRHLQALRTPPFYAIRACPSYLTAIGGIKINHNMEVIDEKDNVIPGLFAAGNDTGGWELDTYNALLTGATVSFALSSGRICGENAARYLKR